MKVGVGYGDNPNSEAAGRQAAKQALLNSGREDPCDLVLLFCTACHNPMILRGIVADLTGCSNQIYGGGAVGIITNDDFGYAGNQVGVACIWFDGSVCNVVRAQGLRESEVDTGIRLGKQFARLGIDPDSQVIMFYDAIDQSQDNARLLMATWLLQGIEKELGFLPALIGAGLQGNHLCAHVRQFIGNRIDSHYACALTFSDDICMDYAVMHGCKPSSPYYTVTKTDGATILEINGQPALSFLSKTLAPDLKPEDFPFFLLLGVNHSGNCGDNSGENYASRLCFGIDKERDGIIMFEPDIVAGTSIRIMVRSLELDYMKPKIQGLLDKLDEREPFFALYIDCAGRCAGYGGIELEDACVIQDALGDEIPLLGIYSGVEIAPVGGYTRGLDWTGVLCVLSKRTQSGENIKKQTANGNSGHGGAFRGKSLGENPKLTKNELKILAEQNTSKILSLDAKSIALRHELEQKRRGFSLLAELSVTLRQGDNDEALFFSTAQCINAALNMQKTVALVPDTGGRFYPAAVQGYTTLEEQELFAHKIDVDARLLNTDSPLLVTLADDKSYLVEVRRALGLPCFISVPVVAENSVIAILITGRMVEQVPFLSRLTYNDVETIQAISALLGSILIHKRLTDATRLAQTDALTGVYNRRALEWQVPELMKKELESGGASAFVMIDIDYFKEVNDKYGHFVGDVVLKELARVLRDGFRDTDIVARLGGDEFTLYCALTAGEQTLINKISELVERWNKTPIRINEETSVVSSLSVGISIAPRDGTSYNELMQKADSALYKSKQCGRNQYTVFVE